MVWEKALLEESHAVVGRTHCGAVLSQAVPMAEQAPKNGLLGP